MHVLDNPGGLGVRAQAFLAVSASREEPRYSQAEDERDAARAERLFGVACSDYLDFVNGLRARFGGLRYHSRSWSFSEEIVFAPVPDFDDSEDTPYVSFVQHTVAHPFGVWVAFDGSVHYMFPNESGGEYVLVFSDPLAMIESDALHAECQDWQLVAEGRADTYDAVAEKASALPVLPDASGPTESWHEHDGFRVFLWRTDAVLYEEERLARWAVWARDDASAERARVFVGSPVTRPVDRTATDQSSLTETLRSGSTGTVSRTSRSRQVEFYLKGVPAPVQPTWEMVAAVPYHLLSRTPPAANPTAAEADR